ncbi:MAG: hypothetical protein JWQ12_1224 [Glaciihabitans sp.]|nr:hypothetical protein [Glaciihabitans sp.]
MISVRKGRIVVFGDVIDDVVAVPDGSIRVDTDTPSMIRFRPGGSAANTAAWLGMLDCDVDFYGRVGAPDLHRHTQLLSDSGVRPFLSRDPELPTGTIVIVVEGEQRTMLTDRGANDAFDPDEVSDETLEGARLLHFTGYSLFGRAGAEPVKRLVSRARAKGVEVSVDPGSAGFLVDYGVDSFLDAVAGASLIFPNYDEGAVLTGLTDPAEIAAALSQSFDVVVLTMGIGGVYVARTDRPASHIPSLPSRVLDPTGAGDAFCAGFLDTWITSGSTTRSARSGARVAARAVTVMGARPTF